MLGDSAVGLFALSVSSQPRHVFSAVANVDPSIMMPFEERFSTPETNLGFNVMLKTAPLGVTVVQQMYTDQAIERMDFYQEILRPANIWHATAGKVLSDNHYLVPFSAMRSRGAGVFSQEELTLMTTLMPHLNRAIRGQLHRQELEARVCRLDAMVDQLPYGVIVTEGDGRVRSLNRTAESIMAEVDGLLIQDGLLRAAKRQEALRLRILIQEAAGGALGREHRSCGAMEVSRPSGRRPLPLVASPIALAGAASRYPPTVSIVVTDLENQAEPDSDLLAHMYGLTKKEAQVAALLIKGLDLQAMAVVLGISMNTMRTHIKHLFLKTGATRLPELVRLLVLGPAALRH